jgi:hypothetical protein
LQAGPVRIEAGAVQMRATFSPAKAISALSTVHESPKSRARRLLLRLAAEGQYEF